jgi:outer membrane protein OmpA-like peptidoglycan-associated protein
MKTSNNLKENAPFVRSLKYFIVSVLLLANVTTPLQAQEVEYTKPSLWLGAAAGANFNFYRGTTQQLNADLTVPTAFHHGKGLGLYLAPLVEYHRPDSRWGVMLQLGFDSRKGSFDRVITPCNCPADLSTNLSYISVEPSLRFAPFKSSFYLYAGPRFAFNRDHAFTYELGTNADFPDQEPNADIEGDFSNTNKNLISMQVGAGYDILLSSAGKRTQTVLSPFVSFQPYFGQAPRSSETWNVTTLRVGAAIKFGRGREIVATPVTSTVMRIDPLPVVHFTVNSPKNIPVERRVSETFPLRNYVYFDLGSTEIPDRYVLLEKSQVKDFKEDQLEVFAPKQLSGRSARGMTVYYNVLNIVGDRMGKNPSANITLVGSSEKGIDDAKAMAESVKNYLVSVFGINSSRIRVEGRDKPKIASTQSGATQELKKLHEDDRRVSIESGSAAMLMEFQSGPNAPLKQVEINSVQVAPIDSYVTFNVVGAKEHLASWSIEVKDEKGVVQNFGPYYFDKVSLPGKSILGTRSSGNFAVTMIGKTKDNRTIKKEAQVHMVLWTPSANEQGMRYSVIYEFNDSESIAMYEKYLTEIVAPKIPKNSKVIVHGYTDTIGDEDKNQLLSLARAKDVKTILERSLAKAGRTDVKFELYGFGEDQNVSPFDNKWPEERAYNRTVLIDIIPDK